MDGGEPSSKMDLPTAFDYVGFCGPEIMVFLVIFSLWGRTKYLLFYFVFWLIDWKWLNSQLKMYFKQPRPIGYNSNNSATAKYETFSEGHNYGMPSGHASSVFYSLIFLFLCNPMFTSYSMAGILIVAITLFQRFKTKRHTAEQLAAGAVEGAVVAKAAHWIASHMIINGLY